MRFSASLMTISTSPSRWPCCRAACRPCGSSIWFRGNGASVSGRLCARLHRRGGRDARRALHPQKHRADLLEDVAVMESAALKEMRQHGKS